MLQAIAALLNLALLLLILAGIVAWGRLLWKCRGKSPRACLDDLVPARERERPFWTPAEALLAYGLMILLPNAILIVLAKKGVLAANASGEEAQLLINQSVLSILVFSGSLLAVLGITLAWMSLLRRDAAQAVGFQISRTDLRLGLLGVVLILPIVMLVSALVSQIVPYEHPVLESLAKNGTPAMWLSTFFATAIVTPVFEEFMVRGLLQGSIQGLADRIPESSQPQWKPRSYWPVIVASLIFALLHFPGQGAAPIPIFVLSLGLGYLYRQTGSLLPPIIVHMVLNSLTLLVEFFKISSS